MEPAELDSELRRIYGGRRWILAFDIAAGAAEVVATLRRLGAADVLVVAATTGVGEMPDAETFSTGSTGETVMGAIRAYFAAIEQPDRRLLAAIEGFDPDGEAGVLTVPFGSAQAVAGRQVYGARRPGWAALEDKMLADELWRTAGVATAPSVITTPEAAPGIRFGAPLGTVWVADNREGWHGGADYVRWVRDDGAAASAAEWFGQHADRVRVMPFLEGIPCSIHGIITGDGIAVLRPLEMIVLRTEDTSAFLYAGVCNFWDPDGDALAEMRAVALAVGELLRGRVDYLGPYGVDGVLTTDGFLPTELNPRLSPGHLLPARAAGLPLALMTGALIEGDLDLSAPWLEETLLEAAATTRAGGMGVALPGRYAPRGGGIVFTPSGAVAAAAGGSDAELTLGPGGRGSYLRMQLDPGRIPFGPSAGPLAVAAIDFARREWGIDLPQVTPAPDLRPRGARGRS